jgi:hypothetical protein
MKRLTTLTVAFTLACVWAPGATARVHAADRQSPGSVQQTSYYSSYQPAPDSTAATGEGASDTVESNLPAFEATSLSTQPESEASAPWKLPQPSFLQNHGIVLGGWVEQGITFNGTPDQFNGPVGTNDWNHEYQLNQAWLFLDRPANNHGEGWAIGGHVDAIYGTDWRFGINNGLETRIDSFNRNSYGLVLPQFYAEVAYNRLSVKMGHFAGILGYEVIPAPANPFYSHSYAMAFGEPLLVTGVQAEYKLSDEWTASAGFNRGWMEFEDNNNQLDFMGGVKWVGENKKTSLAFAMDAGPQDNAGEQDRLVYSIVLQHQLTEQLRYVLQNDMGWQFDTPTAGNTASWSDINQYLLYKVNDKWNANLRAEWFGDRDGVRVGGPPPGAGIRAWPLSGFAGNFYEVTAGLTWKPNANVMVRPEIRYDWYDGPASATTNQLPFDSGTKANQFLFATDLVVTF